jgi:two-component system sensor histidine kinase AgrC
MTDSYQELYLGEESGSYHLAITTFENIFFSVLVVLIGVLCGWLLYRMVRAFLPVRPHWGTPLLAVTMGISAVMVIWVGDPNLLYTLPFYVAGFMLSTRGDRVGRITLCFIFFCMSMSIAALLDTYIGYGFLNRNTDLATRCGRLIITLAIYLGFHRFLPKEPPLLSRNLWMLTLALSLLPMAALCSTVLLTYPRWESEAVLNVSLRVGLGILPFVLITSIVLLAAIIVLARQNAMEQEQALAAQRAIYYEGLQQQDQQLRQLRHDLRNHITAAAGLLELGKVEEARAYLDELGESRALNRPRRFCENETVNIVLAAKADALAQSGSPPIFRSRCPLISPSPTPISARFSATPSTTPAKQRQASPAPLCACAAAPTRGFSCSPSTIRSTERFTPIFPPRNRTSAPTATGCRACGASASATAERWKPVWSRTASTCSSVFRRRKQSNKKAPVITSERGCQLCNIVKVHGLTPFSQR